MEPTLPDGCSILFDRSRRDRREHGIYVVRTDGGLILKRAAKRGSVWGAREREPSGRARDVVGEVARVAQTLVGPRRRSRRDRQRRRCRAAAGRKPRPGLAMSKGVHGLVSAALAADSNPFLPDLLDETLAALARHRIGRRIGRPWRASGSECSYGAL